MRHPVVVLWFASGGEKLVKFSQPPPERYGTRPLNGGRTWHPSVLACIATAMGKLPVVECGFPALAVWNDVVDRAVVQGVDLILAKATNRRLVKETLSE